MGRKVRARALNLPPNQVWGHGARPQQRVWTDSSCPPNLYSEALIPNVMLFGSLQGNQVRLGRKGGTLISSLLRGAKAGSLTPRGHAEERPRDDTVGRQSRASQGEGIRQDSIR